MTRFSHEMLGTNGQPVQGVVEASNIQSAMSQAAKFGRGPIKISEVQADGAWTNPASAITTLQRPRQVTDTDTLEIRDLPVSGDGQRLAVAGARRGKRVPKQRLATSWALSGNVPFDVLKHGEVQLWDAKQIKLLTTITGKPNEVFEQVSPDELGVRVGACATCYDSSQPNHKVAVNIYL